MTNRHSYDTFPPGIDWGFLSPKHFFKGLEDRMPTKLYAVSVILKKGDHIKHQLDVRNGSSEEEVIGKLIKGYMETYKGFSVLHYLILEIPTTEK